MLRKLFEHINNAGIALLFLTYALNIVSKEYNLHPLQAYIYNFFFQFVCVAISLNRSLKSGSISEQLAFLCLLILISINIFSTTFGFTVSEGYRNAIVIFLLLSVISICFVIALIMPKNQVSGQANGVYLVYRYPKNLLELVQSLLYGGKFDVLAVKSEGISYYRYSYEDKITKEVEIPSKEVYEAYVSDKRLVLITRNVLVFRGSIIFSNITTKQTSFLQNLFLWRQLLRTFGNLKSKLKPVFLML